jgi:hypothetical protein
VKLDCVPLLEALVSLVLFAASAAQRRALRACAAALATAARAGVVLPICGSKHLHYSRQWAESKTA